jgi:predicted  nucleic acid-binding Zn-ribbon protein
LPIFRSSKALSEQRKRIKSKKHELSLIREEISAAQGRAEMAEYKRRKQRAQQEFFRLQRELRAAKGAKSGETITGALPDFLVIGTMKGGRPSSTTS